MTKTSVKTPKVEPSSFTQEYWQEVFETKRAELKLKDINVLDALVSVDESYNQVKGGRYSDYKNVCSGNGSLLVTKHVCDTLEAYFKKGKRMSVSLNRKIVRP